MVETVPLCSNLDDLICQGDGRDGQNGRDGRDGRDKADEDKVPKVSEERSLTGPTGPVMSFCLRPSQPPTCDL